MKNVLVKLAGRFFFHFFDISKDFLLKRISKYEIYIYILKDREYSMEPMASTNINLNNLNFICLESPHAFRPNYKFLLLAYKILALAYLISVLVSFIICLSFF